MKFLNLKKHRVFWKILKQILKNVIINIPNDMLFERKATIYLRQSKNKTSYSRRYVASFISSTWRLLIVGDLSFEILNFVKSPSFQV